jgi:hypothetical protein
MKKLYSIILSAIFAIALFASPVIGASGGAMGQEIYRC